MDLPRIIKNFSLLQDPKIEHHYGNISNLNLVVNKAIDDQIYILQEPVTRGSTYSGLTGVKTGKGFTGALSILKISDMDMQYFAEVTGDDADSKYTKIIEPLLAVADSLENYLICEGLELTSWNVIDMIDFLDENRDGILIRFTINNPL